MSDEPYTCHRCGEETSDPTWIEVRDEIVPWCKACARRGWIINMEPESEAE